MGNMAAAHHRSKCRVQSNPKLNHPNFNLTLILKVGKSFIDLPVGVGHAAYTGAVNIGKAAAELPANVVKSAHVSWRW